MVNTLTLDFNKKMDTSDDHISRNLASGDSHSVGRNGEYWQVGKCATNCFQNLYQNQLWTDVRIRCREHVADKADDVLRAHKAILAARSPVFSVLFYGWNNGDGREGPDVVDMKEYRKKTVDSFLRYLYTDQVTLETDVASELFQLAHFYQVTSLVDVCSDILSGRLTVGNACAILGMAVLYDIPTLREAAVDFIDANAGAVLKSDGFLFTSRDTLEYLLKGDTLFAEELTIAESVYQWAATNLRINNNNVTVENIRDILGYALYYLRIQTLNLESFLELEGKCSFHTREECLDLTAHFATGRPQNLHCTSSRRVFKVRKVSFRHEPRILDSVSSIVSQIGITSHKNIKITEIGIAVPSFFVKLNVHTGNFVRLVESALQLQVTVQCPQTGFKQVRTMAMQSEKVVNLSLDPPVIFEETELSYPTPIRTTRRGKRQDVPSDYMLEITITCPALPNICFHQYMHKTVLYDDKTDAKATICSRKNVFVKSLTFVQHSGRSQNDEPGAITPKVVDTNWDQNLKSRLERSRFIFAITSFLCIIISVCLAWEVMHCQV